MPVSNARLAAQMLQGQRNSVHRDYLEETLFEAVVTAGAIVALADGAAESCERAELVGFVERSHWLETYTPGEAAEAFDSRVRQFELAGGIPAAMSSLRRVGDTLGASIVLAAGERVAAADGHVQTAEEAVLRLIRQSIKPAS